MADQQITFDAMMSDLGLTIQSPVQKNGKQPLYNAYSMENNRRAEVLSLSQEQMSSQNTSNRVQHLGRLRNAARMHPTPTKLDQDDKMNDQFKDVLKKIKHEKIERERKQK